jgi:dihydroorotate dehydrogenase (fumarate)
MESIVPDLSTTYLGLHLTNPLVPSASPLSRSIDSVRRMEDAGAAAIVLHSLFEEQIELESHQLDRHLSAGTESHWEASSYYPERSAFALAPDQYLEHLRLVKRSIDIPVIASLNGTSAGGWIKYARLIEQAGADALELNVYNVPTDPRVSGARIEETTLELVRQVRQAVTIPLAVKLSPFYGSLAYLAHRLDALDVDGLVLFNRFNQPDIDLDTLEVITRPLISRDGEGEALRLPLRWIAILYGRLSADLAATGGVHSAHDVLKLLMVGASVAMLASELLVRGVDRLHSIRQDLTAWLDEHEYASVSQLRGSMSQRRVPDPGTFERAHYIRSVGTFGVEKPVSAV